MTYQRFLLSEGNPPQSRHELRFCASPSIPPSWRQVPVQGLVVRLFSHSVSHKSDRVFSCHFAQDLVMSKTKHTCTVQFKIGVVDWHIVPRVEGCTLHGFWWVGNYNVTKWLVSHASAHPRLQSLRTVHRPWMMCWHFMVQTTRYGCTSALKHSD